MAANQPIILVLMLLSGDCMHVSDIVSPLAQGPEHLPAYKPGGRLETFDIEELVAEGKAG